MSGPEPPRKYRPVGLWFLGILAAVIVLAFLGDRLQRWANETRSPPGPPAAPPAAPAPSPAPDPAKALAFVLRGTVRGADGKAAVPGAVLEVVPRTGRRELLSADGKGAYSWTSPDPAPSVMVWAFRPGVGLGHVFVQGSPGRTLEQDVVLVPPRARTLELRVGDRPAGKGIPLEFRGSGAEAPDLLGTLARAETDERGACNVALPEGIPLRVRATWPDGRRSETDVPPAKPGAAIVVALGEPSVPGPPERR